MAEILRVDPFHPDHAVIERAAACLRDGGLVAFPTETVYGLGADATSRDAVRRIFAAKGRPATDPLIVHVVDLAGVRPLVASLPEVAVSLASAFWPGPLTLVLPRSSLIPDEVTARLNGVAIRIPAHPVARALIAAAGVPVAAPSANLFSRPSPTRAEHVVADLGPAIDLILDAGPTHVGLESTVLDLTSATPTVLRPGGVSIERLRQVVPELALRSANSSGEGAMPAPGMLTRHYAPRTPLTLFEGPAGRVADRVAREAGERVAQGERVLILGVREPLVALQQRLAAAGDRVTCVELGTSQDIENVAANLYARLRACDAAGAVGWDHILALQIPDEPGLALAVRDRLRRASAGDIVAC